MSAQDTDKPVDVDAVNETASGPGPYPWTFARDVRLMCAELKWHRSLKMVASGANLVLRGDLDDARAKLRDEQGARAELRVELDKLKAEQESGQVALLRIRERAAKTENEKLKVLLAAALGIADALLLTGSGPAARLPNFDTMDRLHAVRAEAGKLGVE